MTSVYDIIKKYGNVDGYINCMDCPLWNHVTGKDFCPTDCKGRFDAAVAIARWLKSTDGKNPTSTYSDYGKFDMEYFLCAARGNGKNAIMLNYIKNDIKATEEAFMLQKTLNLKETGCDLVYNHSGVPVGRIRNVYMSADEGAIAEIELTNPRKEDKQAFLVPKIARVIFNAPATIVIWSDGTKTIVKCGANDTFDPEKGLAMAISKKTLGNGHSYYDYLLRFLPKEYKK